MSPITHSKLRESEEAAFQNMVLEFYGEPDDAGGFMTRTKVVDTIARSKSHANELEILLFRNEDQPVGYCILSSFWSNEYGGLITIVDELYVQPAFQGRGTAKAFLEEIAQQRKHKGLLLEVFRDNPRAFELYQRCGFEVIDRIFMQKHH